MYGILNFSLFFKVKLGKLMGKIKTLFSRFLKIRLFWDRDYKLRFSEIEVRIIFEIFEDFYFKYFNFNPKSKSLKSLNSSKSPKIKFSKSRGLVGEIQII